MRDFLVVGAGLFGAVFARCAAERGKRSLVIDRRSHIGGNCYTETVDGIRVHRYGPHSFHTNDKEVWEFLNRFVEFNSYQLHTKVDYRGKIYSFPINMMTLNQLWGVRTPEEARRRLDEVRVLRPEPQNDLESWIVSQVGEELYETFVKGYTMKQWGRHPRDLPSFIIRRLPIRLTYDDRYFSDRYQGIPIGGYTRLFENILDHPCIEVALETDYFDQRRELERDAHRTVYTGMIDEFFDYRYGELEYRSLRFETKRLSGDYQGNSVINHTDGEVAHTRVVEHKHFEFLQTEKTVVTWEYPDGYERGKIPYYPIQNERNTSLYARYKAEGDRTNVIFGGRLGTYRYYDMHQVVGQALATARKCLGSPATDGD